MNEKALKALIDDYKPMILEQGGKDADRFLMILAKEIERTTRHAAVQLAHDLAQRIDNLKE